MVHYKHCIVTFLDLLGFAQMIGGGASPPVVLKMLRAVRKAAREDADTKNLLKIEYLCISDCMIRSLALNDRAHVTSPELQSELLQIMHMQVELLIQGFPVRGALTHGKVYFKGRTLFGPAYQEAYKIESQVAKVPRIVIDKVVLENFVGYPEGRGDLQWGNAQDELSSLIRRDNDGEWFIDYLRAMVTECESDEGYRDFLIHHRRLVLGRLAEHATNPDVHKKYVWMQIYHNRVVSEIPSKWFNAVGVSRTELVIPTTVHGQMHTKQ